MKTTITALCNQKGGVGKTTSCLNLGVGLAQEGKKVLLVDCDPQGSLTISAGCAQPDSLQDTLSTAMLAKMMDTPYDVSRAILRHGEGVDILPANIELSGVEVTMVNAMSREKILKQTLEPLKEKYDHMVDERKIAFNPAVELSYLKKEEQTLLLEAMDSEQATPSLSQAQRLKKFSQQKMLSLDVMRAVMREKKKNDLDRVTLKNETLRKYFPKSYTPKQMEDTIIKLLEGWYKKRQLSQER